MKYLDKIFAIAIKVKTPLSITGLSVVVLYLLIKQILSLDVFANVGEENTYLLLSSILDKIFWFAIIALFLGVFSYIISFPFKKKSKKSDVILIDARNDDAISDYIQTEEGNIQIKNK